MDDLHPPLCRAVFHVGVRGDRDLGPGDGDSLQGAIREVLREIAAGVQAAAGASKLFLAEPPILRCISPLASGTDRAAASEALALGFKLQVCVAGRAPGVTSPGTAGSGELARLLSAAEAVVSLGCDNEPSPIPDRALAAVVLNQADLLLAVDDGMTEFRVEAAQGVAGRALESEIPIVAVGASAPHPIRVIGAPGDEDWREHLKRILVRAIDPFTPANESAAEATGAGPPAYFQERRGGALQLASLSRFFESLVLIRSWRTRADPAQPAGGPVRPSDDWIAADFAWADTLAVRYASLYRSAFVLRYLLILPQAIGLVVGFFSVAPTMRAAGFILQWLALIGTIGLSLFVKRTDWHQRFTSYRLLAELLRHQRYLGRFGLSLAATFHPVQRDATGSDWVIWRFRSIVRQDGLKPLQAHPLELREAKAELRDFLKGQMGFYRRAAARYGLVSARLWRLAVGLFWADFCFITLRLGVVFLRAAGASSIPGVGTILDWFEDTSNEFDIMLPSIFWIVLAVGDGGGYFQLSDQYGTMATVAEELVAEVDRAEPTYPSLARLALRTATSLTREVADWHVFVSNKIVPYLY